MEKVKFGIIGVGNMGYAHLQSFATGRWRKVSLLPLRI